jgi:hypothetical protein
MATLQKICAWCKRELPGAEVPGLGHDLVSHGCCSACLAEIMRDMPTPMAPALPMRKVRLARVAEAKWRGQ